VFTEPFPGSGRLSLLIKNLLVSNGRRSLSVLRRCLETNVVSEPITSNICFSGCTALSLSKYAKIFMKNPTDGVNSLLSILHFAKICQMVEKSLGLGKGEHTIS
jgi:hypothetical protein